MTTTTTELEQLQDKLKPELLPDALAAWHQALTDSVPTRPTKNASLAEWDPLRKRAKVISSKGTTIMRMGQRANGNVQWIWPEEALFLLERGDLALAVPDSLNGGDAQQLSVRQWRARVFAACNDAFPARYTIYCELKRAGYIVAPAGEGFLDAPRPRHGHKGADSGLAVWIVQFLSLAWWTILTKCVTAVLGAKFESLPPSRPEDPQWMYNVWKPTPHFKLGDPPPVDFVVMSANQEGGRPVIPRSRPRKACPMAACVLAFVDQGQVHFFSVRGGGVAYGR
ncbi:hypothetical protein BC828DRAFT_386484 [Blastocladiella britannica]|nr:hypothetical protein BC828DRAFT_386484 [Blastocladiella britannica]